MLHFFKIEDLTRKTDPEVFSEYLENKGWSRIPGEGIDLRVYRIERYGILFQATIPFDSELDLYGLEMYRAVDVVAEVERILPEQLVARLLGLEKEEKEIVFVRVP